MTSPSLTTTPPTDRSAMNCDCGTCCNTCGHYDGCTSNQTEPDDE